MFIVIVRVYTYKFKSGIKCANHAVITIIGMNNSKHGHFSQIDFFALTIGQTAWAIWARLIVKIFTFLMKNSIYFAFSVGKSYFGSFYMKDNKHLIDFFHDFPNKICFVIKNFNMNHLGSF